MDIILCHNKLLRAIEDIQPAGNTMTKPISYRVCARNKGAEDLVFDTVLRNGTVECKGCICPPGGYIVVQPGGELNYFSEDKFDNMYIACSSTWNVRNDGVLPGLLRAYRIKLTCFKRGGIDDRHASSLYVFAAESIGRSDTAWKLPCAPGGVDVGYAIKKPWGPGGSLIDQCAKSGDFLIRNGLSGDLYFNHKDGGTMSQYEADLGNVEELPFEVINIGTEYSI